MALCTADVGLLKEVYAAFLTNSSRIDEKGGMLICYTPDIIPGTPHGQVFATRIILNTGISRFASYHHLSWHAVGTKDLFLEWKLFPMPCRRIRDKVSGYANVEGVCVNGALRDAYRLFRPAVGQMICLFMGEGCAPKAERVQLHFQNGKNLRLTKQETVLFS